MNMTQYTCSTHRMCAERRLVQSCAAEAARHGVPRHGFRAWLHRKTGGVVTVVRFRADGSLGCSVPCIACREVLVRHGLRVRCVAPNGSVFAGDLADRAAPASTMTSGQRRERNMHMPRSPRCSRKR